MYQKLLILTRYLKKISFNILDIPKTCICYHLESIFCVTFDFPIGTQGRAQIMEAR